MKEAIDTTRYAGAYFLGSETIDGINIKSKTSPFVEREIMKLLVDDGIGEKAAGQIKTEFDDAFTDNFKKALFLILAWKVGAIAQSRSEEEQKICFTKACKCEAELTIKTQFKSISIDSIAPEVRCFATQIYKANESKNPHSESDAKAMFKHISCFEKSMPGVGDVYAFTLLFFISSGKWPIFDRFVKYALRDLTGNTRISKSEGISGTQYALYIASLDALYPGKWQIHKGMSAEKLDAARNIDRALWVYGHKEDVRQDKKGKNN